MKDCFDEVTLLLVLQQLRGFLKAMVIEQCYEVQICPV